MITPIQKHLLVELRSAYKNFTPTDEKFGTSKTSGVVRGIAADIAEECKALNINVGDTVYFGKYEDTAPYKVTVGTQTVDCILIKLEELGGRSDAD